jgi:glycosyltransferase involved in cell wall biosynthesis
MSQLPFVSVVVITYNSARTLSACLDSIFAVDYPRSRYEVLIVDGGSVDKTVRISSAYHVDRIMSCPRGRSVARNLGMLVSRGQIIAFTDSDCTVGKNWLAVHVANHRLGQDVLAVGGPVEDGRSSSMGHANHICAFGELTERSGPRNVSEIPCCNMSVKRSISELVGVFDTRLDGIRGATLEDTDLCWRIVKGGHRIMFDPTLVVRHYPGYAGFYSYLWKQFDAGRARFRFTRLVPSFPRKLPHHPALVAFSLVPIWWMRAMRQILKAANLGTSRDIAPKVLLCLVLQAAWWSHGYLMSSIENLWNPTHNGSRQDSTSSGRA